MNDDNNISEDVKSTAMSIGIVVVFVIFGRALFRYILMPFYTIWMILYVLGIVGPEFDGGVELGPKDAFYFWLTACGVWLLTEALHAGIHAEIDKE